jgi:hypothetical protein
MIDVAAVTFATFQTIQPFLPEIAKGAAGAFGKESLTTLWKLVSDRFSQKPATKEVLVALLNDPKNADVQGAFRFQLSNLLKEDDKFAEEVQRLVKSAGGDTYSASAKVEGSDNITVQGSNNQVTIERSSNEKKKRRNG